MSSLTRVKWEHAGLQVTSLRLVPSAFDEAWEVADCHGFVGKEPVRVDLPFKLVPKGRVRQHITHRARRVGVYAKGNGTLDAVHFDF